MVPSPGNQNNDAVDDATNAVGESPSLTYDNNSNGSRPSRLSSLDIFLLSSWCMTRAINDCADEELTSDYHMWNQQYSDSNLLLTREEHRAASIAACFLKDYEDGRPPTLSPKLQSISDRQLQMYRFKHSTVWSFGGLSIASILLFVADGPSRIWTLILNMTAVTLFGMDLYMKRQLHMENYPRHYHAEPQSSTNRSTLYDRLMMYAVALFLFIFTIQSWLAFWLLYDDTSTYHPFTWAVSFFKPIVFFYQSRRARDAFEALSRIGKKLLRVILIELFLILTFAAVACRLYSNDENFQTLGRSWLSLFALSTTVVNPSIWMPAYNESRWNAIFFVTFIVVGVFYLHSLVLSVVFQVFIKSATEVHRRSVSDKEQSLRLAYLALTTNSFNDTVEKSFVHPPTIREAFRLLRPHYSRLKTKVLMDIVLPPIFDTSKQQIQRDENLLDNGSLETRYPLTYTRFRNRIRQALTSSVRVARSHSVLGLAVEVLGATGAICNLVYVILLTSKFDVGWFVNSEFALGSILTFAALVEATLRYNPIKFAYRLDPMSRLNAILDGTGTIGALVSLLGIILKLTGDENGLDFLLTGRAIGMIQSMRFSVWFREVLQRSLYVLPLLSGPIFLVLSTMHVFVCCGMLLWSGSVDVDELSTNENVESLFYLNNFNSYGQGFITIFNVLVVNDWNQIANVFLYADRHSDPVIVYLFFVAVVIVAVCIMLNVIVAFFVETFMTQLNLVDVEDEVLAGRCNPLSFDATELHKTDIVSTNCSVTGEALRFDVIQREGYDEIMESVANQNNDQSETFAKSLRDTMENLATMSATSDRTGHLICCRQSMSQFSTESFQRLVGEYLRRDKMQTVLLEMLEQMSDFDTRPISAWSFEYQGVAQQHSHPSDSTRFLFLKGMVLPNNPSIAVLTAEVISAYS